MIITDQRFIIGHKECEELPKEVEQLLDDWVATNCSPIKSINRKAPHVGLIKHAFENDTGRYMPRENMARAMMRAGYYCDKYGNFNISSKCPAGITSSRSKFFKKHAHGIDDNDIIIAAEHGIRYPYLTNLRRDFAGYYIDDYKEELKLYAHVPFITYTTGPDGKDLDWMILKRIDGKEESYYLLQPERCMYPIKVELIEEKWVSHEEYDTSHTKYDNDFFGEVDHDDKNNEYMYMDVNAMFEKYKAGTPVHCAWFKLSEPVSNSNKINYSELSPFIPVIMQGNWQIFQSIRDRSKYIVIDPSRNPKENAIEIIAARWLTNEECEDAASMYKNDYYGVFHSITDFTNPVAQEAMRAGKRYVGWFKIIEG